jgi:nucleoside-diphosphate-sugar epimerase
MNMAGYPEKITTEEQLEELLSRPTTEVVELVRKLDGDIMFLGIAGKIGPSLARVAKRACDQAGVTKRIIGVSRFRDPEEKARIERDGIETIQGDLLDRKFLESLPGVKNVIFLAGMKFGSEDNLPALTVEHFKDSRIAAYSTGCVYPLVPVESGGSLETDRPEPVGEYAQSCLGRERMFEYGSGKNGTPVAIIRLNYAVEPRYGVLVDIATKVKNKLPVDLTMGYFNLIWQGDANNMVLRSLAHAASPARVINVTGREILSVREITAEFGKLFGVEPVLNGKEADTALLSNPGVAYDLLGNPTVSPAEVIRWVAGWMADNQRVLDKPTHFEVRDGRF